MKKSESQYGGKIHKSTVLPSRCMYYLKVHNIESCTFVRFVFLVNIAGIFSSVHTTQLFLSKLFRLPDSLHILEVFSNCLLLFILVQLYFLLVLCLNDSSIASLLFNHFPDGGTGYFSAVVGRWDRNIPLIQRICCRCMVGQQVSQISALELAVHSTNARYFILRKG